MRKTAPLFHQRKKGTHEDIGDGGNGQEEPHETQPWWIEVIAEKGYLTLGCPL